MDGVQSLTNLPTDILINILSQTRSYKSAVRCSAAAKRSRSLYTRMPSLYLTLDDLSPLQDRQSSQEIITTKDANDLMPQDEQDLNALSRHGVPMTLEVLHIKTPRKPDITALSNDEDADRNERRLIEVASAMKIKHAYIEGLCISESIFKCKSLVSLCLTNTIVKCKPETVRDFPSLEILTLKNTRIFSSKLLDTFVSSSPALRSLVPFDIASTSLECLVFGKNVLIILSGFQEWLSIVCPNLKSLSLPDQTLVLWNQMSLFEPLWYLMPPGLRYLSLHLPSNIKETIFITSQDLEPSNMVVNGAPKRELEEVDLNVHLLGDVVMVLILQILRRCPTLRVLNVAMVHSFSSALCDEFIHVLPKASQDVAIFMSSNDCERQKIVQ